MRILLLGGSGFIGSHLADRLLLTGHDVHIFHASGSSCRNIAHLVQRVHIHEGDFIQGNFSAVLEGIDVVVHLVNTTIPGTSLSNPAFDVQSNVIGTIALLDACLKSGVGKLVFLSSGGTIYGIPNYTPIDERHPLNPIAPYGISKLMVEKYLAMYHYHYGLDYTVLRLSNPYGIRQNPQRGQGVLAAWMYRLAHGEPLEIWGDGSVVRDYLHIEDTVAAIELACIHATQEKVFNVGSGIGHSLNDLAYKLETLTRLPLNIDYKIIQKVDVPVNVLDISLIDKELGWRPTISIEEGMRQMWNALYAE